MPFLRRRSLLGQSLAYGGLPWIAGAADDPPAKRLKVVVTGGHPGDPEYGCGGTIARYIQAGHEVVLLYLNEGVPADKPQDGVRVAEARAACEILGARPAFAGQIDGSAVVDRPHADAFRALLEAERPDVVFTHWPVDHHADHRAIASLVHDAWVRMNRAFDVYFYEVSNGEDTVLFQPAVYVDIDATEPTKRRACFAHASQAPEKFYMLQEHVTRMRGIESGCPHAEAFIRLDPRPARHLPGES